MQAPRVGTAIESGLYFYFAAEAALQMSAGSVLCLENPARDCYRRADLRPSPPAPRKSREAPPSVPPVAANWLLLGHTAAMKRCRGEAGACQALLYDETYCPQHLEATYRAIQNSRRSLSLSANAIPLEKPAGGLAAAPSEPHRAKRPKPEVLSRFCEQMPRTGSVAERNLLKALEQSRLERESRAKKRKKVSVCRATPLV